MLSQPFDVACRAVRRRRVASSRDLVTHGQLLPVAGAFRHYTTVPHGDQHEIRALSNSEALSSVVLGARHGVGAEGMRGGDLAIGMAMSDKLTT